MQHPERALRRYLGVTGLAEIVQVDPAFAAEHQMVVVDCLESRPAPGGEDPALCYLRVF